MEVLRVPVRKIPKNHLVVTGGYASAKVDRLVEFESLLEKEYMLLLDFDDTVDRYEEQPVRIPGPGVHQGYVVDLIVHRRHGQSTQLVKGNRKNSLIDMPLNMHRSSRQPRHIAVIADGSSSKGPSTTSAHQDWQTSSSCGATARSPRPPSSINVSSVPWPI